MRSDIEPPNSANTCSRCKATYFDSDGSCSCEDSCPVCGEDLEDMYCQSCEENMEEYDADDWYDEPDTWEPLDEDSCFGGMDTEDTMY